VTCIHSLDKSSADRLTVRGVLISAKVSSLGAGMWLVARVLFVVCVCVRERERERERI